jgi:acetyltransferase-like isoleucine patch superfamily enzyme
MRLFPGVYSAWLRLWGSHIGSFTYWAAGLRILDRGFLEIGSGVAFGAGVRLNPHVVAENDEGKLELFLAPVRIGDRAIIGGYALLTAGTRIADDEVTRACLLSPPFSHWKGGRRIEKGNAGTGSENAET